MAIAAAAIRNLPKHPLVVLLRRDPIVVATLAVFVGTGALHLLPILEPESLELLSRRIQPLLFLPLVLAALRWRLDAVVAIEERRFWTDLTVAFSFWLAGSSVLLAFHDRPRPVGVSLALSLLFALHYLMLLLAIERQPHRQERWRPLALERRLSWATLGLVVTGLFLYFPAVAVVFAPETYTTAVPNVCLYLVLDAYVTLRLAYTSKATRSPRWRLCYALLAAAFLLIFADDLALALYLTGDHATGDWDTPRSLLSSLPFVLIVIAARGRHLRFAHEHRHPATGDRPEENLPGPLGQTLTFILVFPMIHFGVARSPFFAATERPRENLILLWIGLLGVLAAVQYRFLARTIADLRRERQRSERALYQLGRDLALQTERQQLSQAMRASDERFREAFRACPDVMTVSRLSDGRFTDVNPSCQRLFGWTPEEWVGRTSNELGVWVHPEDREKVLEQLRERGKVQDFEGELRRKDGSTDIGLLSATLLELDGEMHFFSVTHGVNAHRRGARAWQRLLAELEDDEGEIARALARWRAARRRRRAPESAP